MRAPAYLLEKGVTALPCIGDGRQSGTSGSPSILNAAPEAAAGGPLALLQNGDRMRIDLNACTVMVELSDQELAARREALEAAGGYGSPDSMTPWQQYFRELVQPFSEGMVLRDAPDYRGVAQKGPPRHNH